MKRAKWAPTGESHICSEHFQKDSLENAMMVDMGLSTWYKFKKDAVPTIQAKDIKNKMMKQYQLQLEKGMYNRYVNLISVVHRTF